MYIDKGKIYSFDEMGNSLDDSWPKPVNSVLDSWENIHLSSIISDFNKDQLVDLFFISPDGTIYLWNLAMPYNLESMDWPMFQHDAQHTGCYDCDKTDIRQRQKSKIVNNGDESISGELSIVVLKWNELTSKWDDYPIPSPEMITIPAGEEIYLQDISNYIFTASEEGTYKMRVTFSVEGKTLETFEEEYEFQVV
jgi:hypothetical protein